MHVDSRTPALIDTDFHWAELQETSECRQTAVNIPCTTVYQHWKKNVVSTDKSAHKPKTEVRFCCTAVQ